jgi:hypothetical protein
MTKTLIYNIYIYIKRSNNYILRRIIPITESMIPPTQTPT